MIHSRVSRSIALVLVLSAGATAAAAQSSQPDLSRVTLEDLMKIHIISASRKEQTVAEVPAAVFVLTQDDIRRSGLRSLPELFRLVPGVQVAQVTSSNWAVSVRGFNDQFSHKLLVLVDGRSIYKRVFSGVFWDAEDLVFDDIDRIEVIRGPGAAIWGANAVNGVINIVTKSARDSQGALVRLSGGTFDRIQGTARYGGYAGNVAYRIYSQWTARGDTRLTDSDPDDDWTVLTNGARLDWTRGRDEWTVDASARTGDGHTTWKFPVDSTPNPTPIMEVNSSFQTGNVLARWTRRADNGSTLQAQSSVAILRRIDFVTSDEDTFDADVHYHAKVGARQDLVVGAGYRFVASTTGSNFAVTFDPAKQNTVVANAFVQDEVKLAPRVVLTMGSKVEHDTFTQWSLQPTVQVMWAPGSRHHVWLKASRALRTPSLQDLVLRVNLLVLPTAGLPVIAGAIPNPDYGAEVLHDIEAGYRLELASLLSIDATAFRGHYSRLATTEPQAPVFEATPGPPHILLGNRRENLMSADTAGLELAARFVPMRAWRFDGSYSTFHLSPHPDATSHDPNALTLDGNAPAQQWRIGTTAWLGSRTEVNASLFHAGKLKTLDVAAYTRADARVEVKLTDHLSAVGAGRNLFASSHPEYTSRTVVATRIPRSADVQLVWKF